LGNFTTFKLAEIDWVASGCECFHFESDRVAMIYNLGELTVVDYERSAPLAALRTEHMSPYLVSCVIGEHRKGGELETVSILAYLVDMQSIRVMDMLTKTGPQACYWDLINWLVAHY
jgi:intraflagellar transport protein 172